MAKIDILETLYRAVAVVNENIGPATSDAETRGRALQSDVDEKELLQKTIRTIGISSIRAHRSR